MLPISLSRARKFISILNFTLWKVKEGRGEKKQQKRKAITTLARPLLVSTINRFSADLYTLSPMHPCKTAWNSQPLYAGKPAEEWERKLALFFFLLFKSESLNTKFDEWQVHAEPIIRDIYCVFPPTLNTYRGVICLRYKLYEK